MKHIDKIFVSPGMNPMILRRSLLAAPAAAFALRAAAPSPGARLLEQFLSACNDSSPAALAERLPQLQSVRESSGGFLLLRVVKEEPALLEALVKENLSDNYAVLHFTHDGGIIQKLRMQRVPRPADIPAPERLSWAQLPAALDQKLNAEAASGRFSGALLLARHGKVLYQRAAGFADRESSIPNTLDTRFRIGSMNKMFTATAALQLVSKGKLDMEAPLSKYLPDYPNRQLSAKVTVRHLLTHTGGTGDIFGPEFDKRRLELRSLNDYIALYGARPVEFEPGSKWNYSNYGFLLLGALIEAVSGTTYYDFVRANIFAPAGMKDTASEPENVSVPRRSKGYMRRDGAWVSNVATLPYRGTSAGGGYSTVSDLAAFAAALQSGKILEPALAGQATSRQADAPMGPNASYGFGMIVESGENPNFGHGGGAPGMNGELKVYPQSGAVVAVLANLDPPAASRLAAFLHNRMPLA
jgi:D-alanyl-D-alanine carboxypeptidase